MPLAFRRLVLKQSATYFIKQAYHAQDAVRLWMGWCAYCQTNRLG